MRLRDRFAVAWTALLAASCAAMAVHPEHEGDAFWHMSLGRAVLAYKARTIPEPLALPAFTSPAVVPEWLWGVITYGVHRVGSWPALVALVALIAAAVAVLATRLVAAVRPGIGDGATALVTGLAAGAVMGRVRLRPEAAGVVLILAFLLLGLRYVEAEGRQRVRFGAALVGVEILWAQIHGSFVLAPALFACVAGPSVFRDRAAPERRTVHVAVAFGLVAGLLTSAYGLGLVGYLATHAHGDAARHVEDLVAPAWAAFDPRGVLDNPYGVVLLVLWAIGAGGMIAARRVPGRALGLAILGGLLAMDAVRFLPIASIFALPLAAEGAAALAALLPERPWWRFIGAAVGVMGLAVGARGVDALHGPLGKIGPAEGIHPLASAAFLRAQPAGGSVISVYNAGGALGFALAGHARTYVDGRTPLYFDDTDFGLSRDVFRYPDALGRAIRRFGATAVVVNRNAPTCGKLPPGWVPAVVEAHFTTFVPAGAAPPLVAIAPCGTSFVREDVCRSSAGAAPGSARSEAADGAAFDEDLRRLGAFGETPFVRYLRAERIVRCGGSLDEVTRLLPSRSEARTYLPQRDALEMAWLLRSGAVRRAVDVAEVSMREGDPSGVALVAPALAGDAVPAARARVLLEAALASLDDTAPPDLRALLALACAAEGDTPCVRFHALRAAARGSRQAVPALLWLRDHDDSEPHRADAEAWLEVLVAEARTAQPEGRGAASAVPVSASAAPTASVQPGPASAAPTVSAAPASPRP
ncbi:Hypothetical protein A7982_02286 [Minicystis rosea]|nr:Hypothetical protein A7982_02286 [Minicystis rosea]